MEKSKLPVVHCTDMKDVRRETRDAVVVTLAPRDEDRALFDAWFAGLMDAGVAGDCLTLAAPTRFHANYIQTHLIERLRIAVFRSDAGIRQVRLTAP